MHKILGIAFDLEGPIVDLEQLHFNGFVSAAKELGMDIDFEIIRTIPYAIGGGDKVIAEGISKLSGGTIDPEELRGLKMHHYNQALKAVNIIPRPGFLEAIHWIKNVAKLPVAIASLTPTAQAHVIFERSGIDRLFPRKNIILLEDIGEKKKKPKPYVYLETARRMSIDPSDQLVFEDSSTGIEAAHRAGSRAVAMPIFWMPDVLQNLVAAGAIRIFSDWREINVPSLFANLDKVGVE